MSSFSTRVRWGVAVLAGALLLPLSGAPATATGERSACLNRPNDTVDKLVDCVRLENVETHLEAFKAIADANGGNRLSGTEGYDDSVDYVVRQLEEAGYDPEVQAFDHLAFLVHGPSALEQASPGSEAYVEAVDFGPIDQSDPGDVTAPVTAVDVQFGLGNTSTSGCEAADFAAFPAGNIALLQRGGAGCTFAVKARNAAAAGAVGVVIFNQGNTTAPDRMGIPPVTLGAANQSGIPVVGTTYALGEELASTPGLEMRVFVNATREVRETYNVLAELRGRDAGDVVMVGGHLDSVRASAGINDNGSGSAAVLEVARQMRRVRPVNTVRFAWWGAEESGDLGSNHYVAQLSEQERADIALYLNFDMIASTNHVNFVYTPEPQDDPVAVEIAARFHGFYTRRSLPSEPISLGGRSDHAPFAAVGIPVGGLFSGAEGLKTEAQRDLYGGDVGRQYDDCYHRSCDNLDNYDPGLLRVNSHAIADATLTWAMDTTAVTGASTERARATDRPTAAPSAPTHQPTT